MTESIVIFGLTTLVAALLVRRGWRRRRSTIRGRLNGRRPYAVRVR